MKLYKKSDIDNYLNELYIKPEFLRLSDEDRLILISTFLYRKICNIFYFYDYVGPNASTYYKLLEYDSAKSMRNIEDNVEYITRTQYYIITEVGIIDLIDDKFYIPTDEFPEEFEKYLVKLSKNPSFKYVSRSRNGYDTTILEVKPQGDFKDLFDNYNDDFPYNKYLDFIKSNKSGLALMYGKPGTGKSSILRHMIAQNPNINFLWMDQSALYDVNSSDFIEFLLSKKNSVIILEDCESLLQSRDSQYNALIPTLLNLSDGILGDSLNIKFICTFNTNLTSLDKALLRKGRLKINYEFKDLSLEKVKNLFNKLKINESPSPMPLCDIYNYYVVNGIEQKKTKSIGF